MLVWDRRDCRRTIDHTMSVGRVADFNHRAGGLGVALVACLSLLVPLPVGADVVTGPGDGQRIRVPVDPGRLERIEFPAGRMATDQPGSVSGKAVSTGGAPLPTGRVLRVGPGHDLKYPSDAARVARDGDTVEIVAGVYPNDYARWPQNRITIRGIGGFAHLKSRGLIPNGKAIWIIDGDDVAIEHIAFSGAAVKDSNGAGIRHQGGDLSLKNTFFHDNEFSILTGHLPDATIEITSSRFWFQRRQRRYSHGIYIGEVRRLHLVGNHFIGTDRGHQVKTRARENQIAYNRIEDGPGGNSSRLIDLSNCGLSVVIGNELHQAATSKNLDVIGFGPEGCERRNERQLRLYVVNNTLINEAAGGVLVNNFAGGDALVANNLVLGAGRLLKGRGSARANLQLPWRRNGRLSWDASGAPQAVDAAVHLPAVDGVPLVPTKEFQAPVGTRARPRAGRLDVGSRETR